MYKKYFKRLIDLILSALALIILSPLLVFISLLLLIANRGTPFFIHPRPGLHEKTIHVIKFKSMNDRRDAEGNLLPDVQRLTPVGRIIRQLSLDELPQLINVLKGDMSLIGPRPLLHKYLPLYSADQRRRHDVRPGITGWAQINGRNSISWAEKFRHDLYYVDNFSFAMDMKILWLTILKVLKREGVNQSVARPMQPFTGDN
jgi:undecaprenyl phosphate N,N'-diacetylbacillosamine 1-phosphate transferase